MLGSLTSSARQCLRRTRRPEWGIGSCGRQPYSCLDHGVTARRSIDTRPTALGVAAEILAATGRLRGSIELSDASALFRSSDMRLQPQRERRPRTRAPPPPRQPPRRRTVQVRRAAHGPVQLPQRKRNHPTGSSTEPGGSASRPRQRLTTTGQPLTAPSAHPANRCCCSGSRSSTRRGCDSTPAGTHRSSRTNCRHGTRRRRHSTQATTPRSRSRPRLASHRRAHP